MRGWRRGGVRRGLALAALLGMALPARADEPAPPPEAHAQTEAPAQPEAQTPAEPQAPPPAQSSLQPAEENWQTLGDKVFDAAVLRPFGAATSLAGVGVFALAVPFAWYSEGIGQLWDILVMEPVDYTFERPLGDF